MPKQTVEMIPGRDFGVFHDIDEKPNLIDFALHNHEDLYEIVMLLEGDCEFRVEGTTYHLQPRDIVFTRPFELHRIVCLTERTYSRIVIFIRADYFKKYSCERFLDLFENRQLGTRNCISKDVGGHALHDCVNRIYTYSEKGEYDVAERTIYELLYLMNNCKAVSDNFYVNDERVRKMILYINENLSGDLSLDALAKKFYVANNYMCRLFKKYTGYTLNQYISRKRIMLVQELHRSGKNLTEACLSAGFNSYSNFYKMYVKLMGTSPRGMDKQT